MEDFLKAAAASAKAAGRVHQKYFHRKISVSHKSAAFDLVSTADTQSEKAIIGVILKVFPGP